MTLLDQWCAGDAAAGNQLFKRHFATLYRFFERKTDRDVDDLVQETFLQCMRARDSFRRQSAFQTYLFAIARHVLFGHWRRVAGGRPMLDFDEISIASLSTTAGTQLARDQDHARLQTALQSLPMEQQLLLELFYWEELDREQLAEVVDVEPATIGSRLFRARQELQSLLGATDEGQADYLARRFAHRRASSS